MMKKAFVFCLSLLLALCLSASALGEAQIVDEADLFTASEEARLNSLIAAFQEETHMDFVILTTDVNLGSNQQKTADDLYDQGGYGLGEDRSGILYYIDMYERVPYLCTTGAMIDYMTDERIEAAHEASYEALRSGDYALAAETMIHTVQRYVKKGIPEGQYRYDVLTGQRLTGRHKVLTAAELGVCALIGLIVAVVFVKAVESRYKLKGNTYEYAFRDNASVRGMSEQDRFLRTTTSRTRKADPPSGGGGGGSSGGSGVHTSSSGTTHGGGAGRSF